MSYEKLTTEQKLTKVKTKFLISQPFFGILACSAKWEENNTIPTMATDGRDIFYNKEFVDSMTNEEALFVCAHEVMHCALMHLDRIDERDQLKWNIATDICINQVLTDDGIGAMPNGGIFNPTLYKEGNGTAEAIYNILPTDEDGKPKLGAAEGFKQADPNKPTPGAGQNPSGSFDNLVPGEALSDLEKAEMKAEMQVKVAQAAAAAKVAGKLSGNLRRYVDELLTPKVPWEQVLRDFVTARIENELDFSRPNRRFAWQMEQTGIIRPTLNGDAIGPIAVAVDCSGSIDQKQLSEFAAEINAIHEDCKPEMLHVIYFDSQVSHYDAYEPDDEVQIEAHGGGGTAFSPIWDFIEEEGIDPVACCVLTDLYCWDFGDAPDYPVLFVSTAQDEAPFGTVVKMT